MQLGSYAHRKLFCQEFLKNDPYQGITTQDWPPLDEVERQRIQALPWLSLQHQKEHMAELTNELLSSNTDRLLEPALQRLQVSLTRQSQAIAQLILAYGSPGESTPNVPPSAPTEAALLDLGFRQYLASFWRWGIWAIAAEQQSVSESVLDLLSCLLQEDAVQSIWFANWAAGTTQKQPWGQVRRQRLTTLLQSGMPWVRALNRFDRSVEDATLSSSASPFDRFLGQLSAQQFLTACIDAHHNRIGTPTAGLVVPQLAPQIATTLLGVLRAWPQRRFSVRG